jgi:hypothetical protein
MIFQPEHREQIRSGEKTMTRRQWDSCRVTEGKTYRATRGGNGPQGLFVPREECDCFICVTDVYRETLGEMDATDARREGGYTLAEFRDAWRDINGEWDPDEQVWVVAFEYAGNSDPEEA